MVSSSVFSNEGFIGVLRVMLSPDILKYFPLMWLLLGCMFIGIFLFGELRRVWYWIFTCVSWFFVCPWVELSEL